MDSSDSFARNIKVFDIRHTVIGDFYTAVLVMERRINKDRLFSDVDAVFAEHSHHCRYSLFDCAFSAFHFYHRSIKPYTVACRCLYAFFSVVALTDNRSRRNVSCFQGVHKRFAVNVYKLCAERTNLFRNERAENLFGECRTRGVILKRILI